MANQPSRPPLSVADLKRISRERLKDAKALLKQKRYDGGVYLCGYAVEIALKARICKTLKWTAFPTSRDKYRSFYVHDLDILLNLSGLEKVIKSSLLVEWSVVGTWDPEVRYASVGAADESDLSLMINATENLLKKLL